MTQQCPTLPPNGFCSKHLSRLKNDSCEDCETRTKELNMLFQTRSTRSIELPSISPKSEYPSQQNTKVEKKVHFAATPKVNFHTAPTPRMTTDTMQDWYSYSQPSSQDVPNVTEHTSYPDPVDLDIHPTTWPYINANQVTRKPNEHFNTGHDYSFSPPVEDPEYPAEHLALSLVYTCSPLGSGTSMAAGTQPVTKPASRPFNYNPISAGRDNCQRYPRPLSPVNEEDPVYSDLFALERSEITSSSGNDESQVIKCLLPAHTQADLNRDGLIRDFESAERQLGVAEEKCRTNERRAAEKPKQNERGSQIGSESQPDSDLARGRQRDITRSAFRQAPTSPPLSTQPTGTPLTQGPAAISRKRKASSPLEVSPAYRPRRTSPKRFAAPEIEVATTQKRKLSSLALDPSSSLSGKRPRMDSADRLKAEGQLAIRKSLSALSRKVNFAEDEERVDHEEKIEDEKEKEIEDEELIEDEGEIEDEVVRAFVTHLSCYMFCFAMVYIMLHDRR